MNSRARPRGGGLTAALAGTVAGTLLQLQQGELWPLPAYAVVVAVVVVALLAVMAARSAVIPAKAGIQGVRMSLGKPWIPAFAGMTARLVWPAAAAAVLAFSLTGIRAHAFLASALDPALEGRDIEILARVEAMPQRTELGLRFRARVESASMAGEPVRVPPRISLGWYGGAWPGGDDRLELQRRPADLRPGERWRMTVRLKAPHGNVNPNGFDYELWLWEQGVQATGYVRAGPRDPPPVRVDATGRHPIEQARHAARDAIFARVADRRIAGILAALVVGDQAAIERAEWDVFRATGVAHLMSISGLHVTMFAWAAALAIGIVWRRSSRLCLAWPAQHAALAGGVALALLYALFSGWGVPAQRTIWMLCTVALLRLAGREWPWTATWLLACAVVAVLDPWALTQAGFWLSFVAVGVLFAAEDRGDSRRSRRSREGRHSREGGNPGLPSDHPKPLLPAFAGMTARLLREQWIVTLALTPLSLLLFGQVSLVGLAANLFAIPWVTLVVTPLALAGAILGPLWDLAALALRLLVIALEWMAGLPFATVGTPAPPLWAAVAGVAGGLLLALRWPWSLRALGIPLLAPVLLWTAPRPLPGEFELIAADVGQGNAVVVRTAGHAQVYDAGPRYGAESDAGHRVVVPLLRAFGDEVDTLVVSHRDSDHSGGAAAVLGMQPNATFLSSVEPQHELQALRRATRCEAGQRWTWDGVNFEVLHPAPAHYAAAGKPNTVSCVLRIGNGRHAALLAGDVEQAQERDLLRSAGASLASDLLLVPHHGSKTSSSGPWLDAVRPSLAIVQAGYRNRFGHPAAPVLARYEERGIRVVQSSRCGAATWRSDRPGDLRCERTESMRYWRHRVP
ncbi:DNA internalization-related competence protein ComEC/Rec2 [Ramlibacter sp.]|uniref:DNA internalization-related competence protein ComEC/Rec2 n=1 Tax=Ramlibacter sp. TaxID=1917967 RepID=UPI003D14479B